MWRSVRRVARPETDMRKKTVYIGYGAVLRPEDQGWLIDREGHAWLYRSLVAALQNVEREAIRDVRQHFVRVREQVEQEFPEAGL